MEGNARTAMGKSGKEKDGEAKAPFVILIIFCLIGSGVFSYLFVKDLNTTLTKMNEEPIASISFKYKSAQRKFIEREIWDKLKQQSPLYNGDTVRTAPLSEATIFFGEDDTIELYEDSIIQIFMEGDELVINVGGGNVVVKAGENSKGIKVRVGKMYTTLKSGTALSAKKDDLNGITSFHVLEGGAYILSGGGDNGTFVSSVDQTLFAEDGSIIDTSGIPMVTVTSPSPNVKVLRTDEGKKTVHFEWRESNMQNDHLVLSIADNAGFEMAKTYDLSGIDGHDGFDVEIEDGKTYWEMHPANYGDKFKAQSQMNVIKASRPELIVPVNEYVLGFKNAVPSIRFSWTDNEWVSKYLLEISRRPDFSDVDTALETAEPFTTVSDLEEGIWYWRVKPTFGANIQVPESVSETRYFLLTSDATMPKAKLLFPADNSTTNVKTSKARESEFLSFSWKKNPDASFYDIKISRDPDFNFTDIDTETSDNFLKLDKEKVLEMLEKSNEWHWAVIQGDENGNISPLSEVRTFSIIDSDYETRLIFPPDGYSVEDSRKGDMAFSWKANFAPNGKQTFQIANDPGFNSIVINREVSNDNIDEATSISSLDAGDNGRTYYWRAIAKNDDGRSVVSKTRAFSIRPPFKAPENVTPGGRVTVGVATGEQTHFEWQAIEGADSYKFKIYDETNTANPVYEDNLVTENFIDVDLSELKNGDYIWTLQANAIESERSTRFTGETAKNEFGIRKLFPAKLVFPADGEAKDGLEEFTTPMKAQWECEEEEYSAIFRLYKATGGGAYKLIQTVQNPPQTVKMPRLEHGDYRWEIEARTADGFDVSSKTSSFSVTKIPPLKEPLLLSPRHQSSISAKTLKRNKAVDFIWKSVPDATSYIITVRDKSGKVVARSNTRKKTSFSLKSINTLSRGRFTWTVEARQTLKDGTVVRKTASRPANFVIDIPVIREVKLKETGELYGL